MLHELDIDSYAVVDRLRVQFAAGLNLLTGETGSGKSIVVGSLAMLFGARSSSGVVRSGSRRARISGIFEAPPDTTMRATLASSGIEVACDELIVERQILDSGKSRAYVNGTPVTVAFLRDLAPYLGDIHGQHEQQTLLSPKFQLSMLDAFAGIESQTEQLENLYSRWRATSTLLERLKGSEQERLQRIDLLRYQAGEIRHAALQPGEDEELSRERVRLAHTERLQQSGFEAYGVLYDSAASASAQIKAAAKSLASMEQFDECLERFSVALEDARNTVDDVAFELRSYLEKLEVQPDRQEIVEERLALLEKLKRKYGPALSEVLAFAERIKEELAALEGNDADAERLGAELQEASLEYERLSQHLSRKRSAAAALLAGQTERELRHLALDKARFEVELGTLNAWTASGVDRVALQFSANPGQPLRSLGQVASGGELSRVALALKTCLEATADSGVYRRTLVFDEIDSGVGGSVAEAIGRRLKQLAAGSQLLCVTHLPQIACFADAHFHVRKTEIDARTSATLHELSNSERIQELARMLSGAEVTDAALANARELLHV